VPAGLELASVALTQRATISVLSKPELTLLSAPFPGAVGDDVVGGRLAVTRVAAVMTHHAVGTLALALQHRAAVTRLALFRIYCVSGGAEPFTVEAVKWSTFCFQFRFERVLHGGFVVVVVDAG